MFEKDHPPMKKSENINKKIEKKSKKESDFLTSQGTPPPTS
jgi:hypothetical protein